MISRALLCLWNLLSTLFLIENEHPVLGAITAFIAGALLITVLVEWQDREVS